MFLHCAANPLAAISPIRKQGDAHAPVLTTLPYVDTGLNTYIHSLDSSVQPGDAAIDIAGRQMAIGFGPLDINATTSPPEPTYVCTLDLDGMAAPGVPTKPASGSAATIS